VHEWLEAARDRLAAEAGLDLDTLSLTAAESEALLELARVAAHESGDRTNAPLACFLAGVAVGRDPSAELERLVRALSGAPE
jgi:hypothetical protein